MTATEKLLVAIMGGGVLYLIIARGAPAKPPIPVPAANGQVPAAYRPVMAYATYMVRYGAQNKVEPALIAAVMTVESGGRADAVGAAGEIGLMQILPSTAKWFGGITVPELRDPAVNIEYGSAYLGYCIDRKGGNVAAGIAAYNYGPDRVRVEGGQVIVPESVMRYVANVLSHMEQYRRLLR